MFSNEKEQKTYYERIKTAYEKLTKVLIMCADERLCTTSEADEVKAILKNVVFKADDYDKVMWLQVSIRTCSCFICY